VVGVSEVHQQGHLKLDAVDDGEPVQLPQRQPHIVSYSEVQTIQAAAF